MGTVYTQLACREMSKNRKFERQLYGPRISRIEKKILPKIVQNFSTYKWVYTLTGK